MAVNRVIAGFGRSGTTWVQDVVARANDLRAVFEPLHPQHIDGANAFAHRFLTAASDEPELRDLLQHFFVGEFRSLWADYRSIGSDLLPSTGDLTSTDRFRDLLRRNWRFKKNWSKFRSQRKRPERLVKLIRANMMLPWLIQNFDARVVYIIRHPVAVIRSQMRAPGSWDPRDNIRRYRADSELVDSLNKETRQLLLASIEDVQARTLCWCIENSVGLQHASLLQVPVVHYEDLVDYGISEWQRILDALELTHLPDNELVSQPSQQTWGRKAIDTNLLRDHGSWMTEIDSELRDRIQRVLDQTGMEVYTTQSASPVKRVASGCF